MGRDYWFFIVTLTFWISPRTRRCHPIPHLIHLIWLATPWFFFYTSTSLNSELHFQLRICELDLPVAPRTSCHPHDSPQKQSETLLDRMCQAFLGDHHIPFSCVCNRCSLGVGSELYKKGSELSAWKHPCCHLSLLFTLDMTSLAFEVPAALTSLLWQIKPGIVAKINLFLPKGLFIWALDYSHRNEPGIH